MARQFYTFLSKSFQIRDHFFPLLFPRDSENLKTLDIGLREVGAKRPVNGVRTTHTKKILLRKANFAQKQFFLRGDCTPFNRKIFNSETTSFHYFSPRIQNLQEFLTSDFGKWGKQTFKRYLKSEHMDGWTHTHTRTF